MHVVAIYGIDKDKETLAGSLAAVLKVTPYEALTRLRSPGNGPLTVAVFADRERAEHLSGQLHSAGFNPVVLTSEEIAVEDFGWVVRSFGLGESGLHIETVKGDNHDISFGDIDLILRGISISNDTSTETVKNRSISLGRAVLSGGMMITRTTKTKQDVTTEARERFINLYSGGAQIVVFCENSIDYISLGSARKPSRSENFLFIADELRRRCPHARCDERLMNRPAQAALLGPSLNPEKHLAVATALLAKVLRKTD